MLDIQDMDFTSKKAPKEPKVKTPRKPLSRKAWTVIAICVGVLALVTACSLCWMQTGLTPGSFFVRPQQQAQATSTVSGVVQNTSGAPLPTQTAVIQIQVQTATPVPFTWDTKFDGNFSGYYENVDQLTSNYRVEGGLMTFSCRYGTGVFLTSDPGYVMGVEAKENGGYVAYLPCNITGGINFQTDFWSGGSNGHNQVHVVEITTSIPASVTIRQLLIALQAQEGKPYAYLFKSDGSYEIIR